MATTYRPAAYPRRPKLPTAFSEIQYQLELAYYRWELHTGSYVMSTSEKWILNLAVLSLLLLFVTSIYYYLPATICMSFRRLGFYLVGPHSIKHNIEKIVIDRTGGAAASLEPNASTFFQPGF